MTTLPIPSHMSDVATRMRTMLEGAPWASRDTQFAIDAEGAPYVRTAHARAPTQPKLATALAHRDYASLPFPVGQEVWRYLTTVVTLNHRCNPVVDVTVHDEEGLCAYLVAHYLFE